MFRIIIHLPLFLHILSYAFSLLYTFYVSFLSSLFLINLCFTLRHTEKNVFYNVKNCELLGIYAASSANSLTLSCRTTYIYIYIYIYMSYRTANLQMLHFIYYSTNIHTEYFKHAARSPFFLFKMPFIS